MDKLLGWLVLVFLGLAALAYLGSQELAARVEAEKSQAAAELAKAQADQAQAEAVKAQAEAMTAGARMQAEALAAQNRLYMTALIGVMIWSVAMVLILAFVILQLVRSQEARQPVQVVYLPRPDEPQRLQTGSSLAIWPERVITRHPQHAERGE